VNIFGIGLPEMALIMVVALLIFGPKKLPEIGRSLGKAIRGFQEASREFENEFKKEAERLEKTVAEPMKATLEPPSQKALTSAEEAAPDNATQTDNPVEAAVIEPETVSPSQQS
jgi:sec-independent protein translocase protein TatA